MHLAGAGSCCVVGGSRVARYGDAGSVAAHAKVGILDRVTLRVHWHESLKLLREAAVAHNIAATDLHGFSLLRRDAETGAWVCDVFVVRMRGALVDNDRTVTFGHEVLHCFGFRHE